MILIVTILFTSALILGVKIVTYDGMALHHLKLKAEASGLSIWEVIVLCEWCMPTIYSFAGYGFAYLYFQTSITRYLLFYPIVVSAASVITGTIWTIIYLLLNKN